MTYEQYINETERNCMTVLSELNAGQLLDFEYCRKVLWQDDRVTGVMNGACESVKGSVADNIKDVLFDERFLRDFNERGMDMQTIMASGPDAIDVVARCLALKHISLTELIEYEKSRRREKDRQSQPAAVRA